ncbi:ExbD/TolR family protein [Dyella acidisoli]|uniref:Biopolymer transport protein exbD1 n=1 Tax=Dyella acidisoli TaxID=1867834 RepID=A0ABQ5XT63_9GAMM|nr:biopolymer transporter ExbD [Dyella acidisoli]GLQ95066.1 biopolymer transport protein exbD1 [Dyella acidisoli]
MAFSARVSRDVMASINVTPLVDVLLVLLIIFMISSPVITHKAGMDLPQASKTFTEPSTPIHLAIHADGAMYWNDTPVSQDQLNMQLSIAAAQSNPPALEIDAADGVAYQAVAQVLADAKAQGLAKIDMLGAR